MLEHTTDENIQYLFSDAIPDANKKDALIKVTKENSDNHSAIVVHILDVASSSSATTTTSSDNPIKPDQPIQPQNKSEHKKLMAFVFIAAIILLLAWLLG